MTLQFFISWRDGSGKGGWEVRNGRILDSSILSGPGSITGSQVEAGEGALLSVRMEAADQTHGPQSTVVTWRSPESTFSFLPVHLQASERIHCPDLGVCLAMDQGKISFESQPAQANSIPEGLPGGREITWDTWAEINPAIMPPPTVLGMGRDERLFEIWPREDSIRATHSLRVPEVVYSMSTADTAGRRVEKRLVDGCLPILEVMETRGPLRLDQTFLVAPVSRQSEPGVVEGTDYRRAHLHSNHPTFPPGGQEEAEAVPGSEIELALYMRVKLTNTSSLPQLAPYHFPKPRNLPEEKSSNPPGGPRSMKMLLQNRPVLDADGVAWTDDAPLSRHKVDGEPPTTTQICPLLAPGGSYIADSMLAHSAFGLSEIARSEPWDFVGKLEEAKAHWRAMTRASSSLHVPEERLARFWQTGHAHLELVTLGREPDEPLLAKVGIYPAIGTESVPIIEFYESIGQHQTAARCLDAFMGLQFPTGRINFFTHYDIETGAVLHTAGLHCRYTGEFSWAERHREGIRKAARYLLDLRLQEDAGNPGHGLIRGTSADGKQGEVSFMLNSYNVAGLRAAARMLTAVGDPEGEFIAAEAEKMASRLQEEIKAAFGRGPLLPVGHDHWLPSCAPNCEGTGPKSMGLKGEFTRLHTWCYNSFDHLLGPLWAPWLGILDPLGEEAGWMLALADAQYTRNAIAESQPYYSRSPEIHLLRGNVDPFLNAFYSGLTSLADRETLTFWEHFFYVSPHKTHEEGWALMQMRRMLWLEHGETLRLLAGIPESWLKAGNEIHVPEAGSYFGPFGFDVRSGEDGLHISVKMRFHSPPAAIEIRLPGINRQQVQGLEVIRPGWARLTLQGGRCEAFIPKL